MTFPGTFYLLDPLFSGRAGHAMNFGGGVARAASQRNILMKMVVSKKIPDEAAASYHALPVFTISDELQKVRHQPVTSQIDPAFYAAYRDNLCDLETQLTNEDILWDYYLLGPIQVDIYSRWLESIAPEKRPKVMVGVDVYTDLWYDWLAPIADRLRALEPWFRVTSTSFINAKKVGEQLGIKVQWMPRPKMARPASEAVQDPAIVEKLTAPVGQDGPLVGYFTDPSKMKSFHLLQDIIPVLLRETSLRFLLQIRGEPAEEDCKASLAVLRKTAEMYPGRLKFVEGVLDYDAYKTAIELCDGMIVAYDPRSHFANTPSGTVCESLAVGTIPIAVAGTSMEKEMRLFDIDIPVLPEQTTEDFLALLRDFEQNSQTWLTRNKTQIEKWNQFQSHDNLFEHLFNTAWQ